MASPLRKVPPRVGLMVDHTPLPAAYYTNTHLDPDQLTANYNPRIMHTDIPAALEQWVVTVDANDEDIARAVCVPALEVRTNWLTSRTPVVDPRPARASLSPYRERRTRAAPVELAQLQKYRDLAVELRTRLGDVAVEYAAMHSPAVPQRQAPRRKDRYYSSVAVPAAAPLFIDRERFREEERQLSPDSAPSDVGSFEPVSHLGVLGCSTSTSASGSAPHSLELGRYVTHTGMDGICVRGSGGLYTGVRHARGLRRGECAYIEMYVQYSGGQGGLAFGACTTAYALDTMVGAKPGSVALHSEARVVRAGHWTAAAGGDAARFGSGDTVGVLMSVSRRGRVMLRITVNGNCVADIGGDEEMRLALHNGARAHLQVSMLRPGARIALRDTPHEWRFDDAGSAPLWKPSRLGCSGDVGSQVLTP